MIHLPRNLCAHTVAERRLEVVGKEELSFTMREWEFETPFFSPFLFKHVQIDSSFRFRTGFPSLPGCFHYRHCYTLWEIDTAFSPVSRGWEELAVSTYLPEKGEKEVNTSTLPLGTNSFLPSDCQPLLCFALASKYNDGSRVAHRFIGRIETWLDQRGKRKRKIFNFHLFLCLATGAPSSIKCNWIQIKWEIARR